jgi:hypothetical protein
MVNVDHRQTQSVMNDVDDVWWCRTLKNSVVYGSGERRIAVSGVSHYSSVAWHRTDTVHSLYVPSVFVHLWLMCSTTLASLST